MVIDMKDKLKMEKEREKVHYILIMEDMIVIG